MGKTHKYLLLLFLCQIDSAFAQLPQNINGFIPYGLKINELYHVDMNQDSLTDIVIVADLDTCVEQNDTMYFGEITQVLFILERQIDGTLKLGARNDVLLEKVICGWNGPFVPELVIKENGEFGIEDFYIACDGGHYTYWAIFNYNKEKKGWFLKEYTTSYVSNTPVIDSEGNPDYIEDPEYSYSKTVKDFEDININDYEGISKD